MNHITLIGRLTRDPERRATQTGTEIASFTLAVDRRSKEKATDFIPVTAFNATADVVLRYCQKGARIAVEGSLQVRTFEDRSGAKQTRFDVIANSVEFLETRKGSTAEPADMDPLADDEPLPF